MRNSWFVFVVLNLLLLGCSPSGIDKNLEYVIDIHINNSKIYFNTELLHVNALDSISFKLNKKIKSIKVYGEGIGSMRIDRLDTYQNLIILSLNGKNNDIIRFEYSLDIQDSFEETTGGRGVLLQGAELIPIVKSEKFVPLTYVFEIKNDSKYLLFSNFTKGEKTTSDKVFMNITEKPFDVFKVDNSVVMSINKDSVFVKNIAQEVSSVVSYYCDLFEEQTSDFVIVVNDFGNHSFYSSPGFVNLYYYNERGVDNKDVNYGYLYSTLYHEVAHKWFSMTNVYNGSPSAFIDEGFADYLTVMYARKEYGEAYFEQIMDRYKEYADGAVSIMSVNDDIEFDERAKSLYGKGMLFCYELELHLGREAFVEFLRLLVREKPVDIDAMMKLIKENHEAVVYDLAWNLLNS